MKRLVTTPFGQRAVTSGLLKSVARAAQTPTLPHTDKWQLLRELCAARSAFGLTDRELGVLEGLLSFHPEQQLGGNAEMIVFPSNRALAERCHGMAESTLRRHLARLVDEGLILRHDSPNGKRYAARGIDGEVLRAFGFDLSPLLVRAPEIAQAALAAREAAARVKALRERLSLQKRDAQKLASYALSEGLPGTWEPLLASLLEVSRDLRRKLSAEDLEALAPRVEALHETVLRTLAKTEEMSANDAHSERLYQNSNTDSSDLEPCLEKGRDAAVDPSETETVPAQTDTPKDTPAASKEAQGLPLHLILKSIPQALEYATDPIRTFEDLTQLASLLRGMIGISPSAWQDAVQTMGRETAGVTICCLVERIHDIRSPGGYLRHLTREAEAGKFSVARLVMAQLQRPDDPKGAKS